MLKKLRSVRGEFLMGAIGAQIALGIFVGLTGLGTIKTARNGVLKKNMKVIGCKMLNKGNDFCDAKYKHLGGGKYYK